MTGDGTDLCAMVMSAAVGVSPAMSDQIGAPGDWASAGASDLDAVRQALGDSLGVSDLQLLDAGDLGDGGIGLHMAMDFGALLGAFDAPDDANPGISAIAMDMYIFLDGDTMLMTFVMWPSGTSPDVDGHDLAQVMDGRAS
jgi:hypothetical protein